VTFDEIKECLSDCRFTEHARREMAEEPLRRIGVDDVLQALSTGEIIEEYPADRPYPSCLVLGRTPTGRPLHVVCAPVRAEGRLVVITTYEPDPERWDATLRHRRTR